MAMATQNQPLLLMQPPATHHGEGLVVFTDYSQWERRPSRHSGSSKSIVPRATRSPRGSNSPAACAHGTATGRGKKVSLIAEHVTVQAKPSSKPPPPVAITRRPSRVKMLEPASARLLRIQVAAKKSSVEDYQKYREELLTKNLSLITSIQQVEDKTHSTMNELLEKYQKFKGSLFTLRQKSSEQLRTAKTDLSAKHTRLQRDIAELRSHVAKVDTTLQEKSKELQTLLHYKDKEYPLRLVRTEQLREQVEVAGETNKAELVELEEQIAEEHERFELQMQAIRLQLESSATEVSLAEMKKSVHEKAIQNKIMEKELFLHQNKREELKSSISKIRAAIRVLREDRKSRALIRRQPLAAIGKCLPDTELHLNFQRQTRLPI